MKQWHDEIGLTLDQTNVFDGPIVDHTGLPFYTEARQ